MGLFNLPKREAVMKEKTSWRGMPIGDSEDLRRIAHLPIRPIPAEPTIREWATDFKVRFGKGDIKCECMSKYHQPCCKDLLSTQAWALYEAEQVGGLMGPIGVGHGKTLLDLLTPLVAKDCKTAVLLLPASLKAQMSADLEYYGQHWKLPNIVGARFVWPGRPTLFIMAFSELSNPKNTERLEQLRPDTFIVDEAHNLRNISAARTKRFMRFFKKFPDTRLFFWSGTLTSKGMSDYASLANLALRSDSPVPHSWPTLQAWASHLDPGEFRAPPGRLTAVFGQDTRAGYRNRLLSTKGVVSSGDAASCTAELVIQELKVEVPKVIVDMLAAVERDWEIPGGEVFKWAPAKERALQQLSAGFYLRWRFPRKESPEAIEKWLCVRRDFAKEVREKLKKPSAHMDSPALVEAAAHRWFYGYTHHERDETGRIMSKLAYPPFSRNSPMPVWASEHYMAWKEIEHTVEHETEAIWVDKFLVNAAREWLDKGPGVLWYQFPEFARAVVKPGFTYLGVGEAANEAITKLNGTERVIASIRAHGTGKKFHMFSRCNVANAIKSGSEFEQVLGRLHRNGQRQNRVSVYFYSHTKPLQRAMERAIELAGHIEGTFGAKQKLNHAKRN